MPSTTKAGRPRDERIDAALLRATTELLEQVGYNKLTIAGVAARAGITAPAIYRRFPSKSELVYAAALSSLPSATAPWDDERSWAKDVAAHVREIVVLNVELLSSTAMRAAFSGLFAEFATEPGSSGALLERLQADTYARLQRCLDFAADEGKTAKGTDAKLLLDTITGAVVMSIANNRTIDAAWIDHTTRLVLKGIEL